MENTNEEWREEDQGLQRLGDVVAQEAARLHAESAWRRAAVLARVSEVLGSSLDYASRVEALARLVIPELADGCVVDMLEPDGTLEMVAVAHVDAAQAERIRHLRQRYPLRDGPKGPAEVARSGRSETQDVDDEMLRERAQDEQHLRVLRELGLRSRMVVPLRAHGRTLGTMTLVSAASGYRYSDVDVPLAEEIAALAAVAIDNALLYRDAQHATRLRDEFLATLSHELRTPLNAVVGWAHILKQAPPDATTLQKGLDTIIRNAQAQARLVEDILDVSRIVAGKLRLELREMDLVDPIEAAVETVRPAMEAKDVRLQLTIDPSGGPVNGDPDRLQQVVWNLLANAVRFAPRGGHVELRLAPVDSDIEVTVEDDGPGIATDFLPHIFERFSQADSSRARLHHGLGLGLAIARHLVELHGGSIRAENRQTGTGAVFRVRLPCRSTAERPGSPNPLLTPERPAEPPLSGTRVLIVDDEHDGREMVASILERAGAEVLSAATAAEALPLLEQARPHAIVADIEMPREDGYAFLACVRALPAERGGRTPTAALTAYASATDRQAALDAGFQVHIPKPVDPSELVRVVARLVGKVV